MESPVIRSRPPADTPPCSQSAVSLGSRERGRALVGHLAVLHVRPEDHHHAHHAAHQPEHVGQLVPDQSEVSILLPRTNQRSVLGVS